MKLAGAVAVLLGLVLVGVALALHGLALLGTTSQPPCYAHVEGFRLPPGGHWCGP